MRTLSATVTQGHPLSSTLRLLILSARNLPLFRPGQLVLIRASERSDTYLRTACFPIPNTEDSDRIAIIVAGDDVSTLNLYNLPTGSQLELIAPVGNGFTLESGARRLLLAGYESAAAPLIALAQDAAQKQIAVT